MAQHLVRHRVALADDEERGEVDGDRDGARHRRDEHHRRAVLIVQRAPAH